MSSNVTKIEQHESITKDFLQDHIDKLITEKKTLNKIIRDKNSYKVNIDQRFPVSRNDFPPASTITPINEKHHRLIPLYCTRTRQKTTNQSIMKKTSKQIRENYIEIVIKMIKVAHLTMAFLITYIKILKI